MRARTDRTLDDLVRQIEVIQSEVILRASLTGRALGVPSGPAYCRGFRYSNPGWGPPCAAFSHSKQEDAAVEMMLWRISKTRTNQAADAK